MPSPPEHRVVTANVQPSSQSDGFDALVRALRDQGWRRGHRHLLVVQGPGSWRQCLLATLAPRLAQGQTLWISTQSPEFPGLDTQALRWLKPNRVTEVLGQEFDTLVIDASDRLVPDAIGAASGTLKAGGVCLLLLASDSDSCETAASPSYFSNWLQQRLEADNQALLVRPQTDLAALRQQLPNPVIGLLDDSAEEVAAQSQSIVAGYRSDDQRVAVEKLCRVMLGHRLRPLVLSADRGRGKSAALGIACAELLPLRRCLIRVTAPSRAAVDPLFERLRALLPEAQHQPNSVELNGAKVEFVALDRLLELVEQHPVSDTGGTQLQQLLMVDEAAAIPASILERLLLSHSRIVFSTTTHGYEGTGRGFSIRFGQALKRHRPQTQMFEINEPIRWCRDDPLERWVFDALLLDAEPDTDAAVALHKQYTQDEGGKAVQLSLRRVMPSELLARPALLRQLFGLLVQAHYRTRPNDLRDLLDDPTRQLWLLHAGDQEAQQAVVLGVLLVSEEGGFDDALAEQVWLGRRRPRGHLLPQVLSAQAGFIEAGAMNTRRVVRIAVAEPLRRQGLGAMMVAQYRQLCDADPGVDLLGTSFGATADLLPFWHSQTMQPLRLGLKPDASSGTVSALYAVGCSSRGRALVDRIGERFQRDLAQQLSNHGGSIGSSPGGAYSGCYGAALEPELVIALLRQCRLERRYPLDQQDQQDLYSFLQGGRGLAQIEPALTRWSFALLSNPELALDRPLQQLLVWRWVQRQPWPWLLARLGYSGQRPLERWLREALAPHWDAGPSREWAKTLVLPPYSQRSRFQFRRSEYLPTG